MRPQQYCWGINTYDGDVVVLLICCCVALSELSFPLWSFFLWLLERKGHYCSFYYYLLVPIHSAHYDHGFVIFSLDFPSSDLAICQKCVFFSKTSCWELWHTCPLKDNTTKSRNNHFAIFFLCLRWLCLTVHQEVQRNVAKPWKTANTFSIANYMYILS